MTGLAPSRRGLVLVSSAALAFLFAAFSMTVPDVEGSPRASIDEYPELFGSPASCPPRGVVLENGRRAEELGLLHSDRYAYNPRDGVRAVERFQAAEDCYRSAGAASDAARVQRARAELSARVNTDYAAARLNLANALQQERWSDALGENRRLLLLTEHVRRHDYVQWLKNDIGTIAARAHAAP